VANSPQAAKRARQAERKRKHNAPLRSMTRTFIKKTRAAINSRDVETAQAVFRQTARILDKMVSKGIVHRNKAARHKSRFNSQIRALVLEQQKQGQG